MRGNRTAAALVALLLAGCGAQDGFRGEGLSLVSSTDRVAELRGQLAARPNDVRLLRSIGDEYARLARWSESAGAYREALLVAPGDREAALGYGRALVGGRSFAAASRYGLSALESRRDREALMLAGVALAAERRTADAEALLTEALALRPRDLAVRTNLAITQALAGDPNGYGQMRSTAYAPDADVRHRRNLVLVAGILGLDAQGRSDGRAFGLPEQEISAILAIGRQARTQGASAFGVASSL